MKIYIFISLLSLLLTSCTPIKRTINFPDKFMDDTLTIYTLEPDEKIMATISNEPISYE
jgi:hypothetical protein